MNFSNYLPWPLRGEHTIFFYLLLLVLGAQVLYSVGTGGLFFFKSTGEKRSNAFFGLLLIAWGLTLLHYCLVLAGIYGKFPSLYFMPIYHTLWFPILLFYHIKLSLYPAYRFRPSDAKHFILPLGQLAFFLVMVFQSADFKADLGRRFFNPFYGAMEQLIFLVSFFMYLFFAYRYMAHKRQHIRNPIDARKVFYANKLIQFCFILFVIHTLFVVTDFVCYELLAINMRASRVYAALGLLSFSAVLFWLGVYGFQVLLWGRKVLNG
jgi:hypothetical protein